jgi:hypothetical protein
MKGATLSIWVWMIGGIVTAGLLILITQTSLVQLGEQTNRQAITQDFRGLNNDISNACRQSYGYQSTTELGLQGVEAVFAAENRSEAPVESQILIANEETSTGKQVCLTFEDSHFGCMEHTCNVNMTYMGMPQEGSDKYILGEESNFQYEATVSKQENGDIRVEADVIP